MSKRLQVLLDDTELEDLQDAARREGVPVSEWVRRALREAQGRRPRGDMEQKLRAVRTAAKASFPTSDVDEMLGDIERGYGAHTPQ